MIDILPISDEQLLKIILGAGKQSYSGWIATQKKDLDLKNSDSWEKLLGLRRVDVLLCEHVWEHLTEPEGRQAAKICFNYLKPGGYIRCAVPDGNFPDPEYQRIIQVGGPGPKDHPAAEHKIVYTYQLFTDVFSSAGFEVELLEYCDEHGRFYHRDWSAEDGIIYRSLRFDRRNQHGFLKSVSLIVDAKKPLNRT